jgi:hypothetical protein
MFGKNPAKFGTSGTDTVLEYSRGHVDEACFVLMNIWMR